MGVSASKAAKGAGSAARQYPTRIPNPTAQTSRSTPTAPPTSRQAYPPPQNPAQSRPPASSSPQTPDPTPQDSDPALSARLRDIGPVRPTEHFGSITPSDPYAAAQHTPAFPPRDKNPALVVLDARQQFQDIADKEFESIGKKGFGGRTLLDATTIRQMLMARDGMGTSDAEIEKTMGLKKGLMGMLGTKEMLSAVEIRIQPKI